MIIKRIFDFVLAIFLITLILPLLIFVFILASIDTRGNGFFIQERIGQFGKPYKIYKFRSMHFTTAKISQFGAFLRRYKIDELPQLINVILGQMSFVGPRPDLAGYYDALDGDFRNILKLKPGLTSEAALKYFDEESLLATKHDSINYNNTVIFPDKVKMNLKYYYERTLFLDIKLLLKTMLLILLKIKKS